MKRPMTLTGGILGTVMQAIYTCYSLFALTLVIDLISSSSGATGATTAIVIMLLDLALAVTTLVLNALCITTWNKSPEQYRKKRGLLIATVVFNFIFDILSIISMVMNGQVAVLSVIIIIALIATNVLILVDLGLESKRVARLSENGVVSENDPQPVSEVEEKIEKLAHMKEQGLISEEEYEELKKSYINEQ